MLVLWGLYRSNWDFFLTKQTLIVVPFSDFEHGCWWQIGLRSDYFKNCWSTGIFDIQPSLARWYPKKRKKNPVNSSGVEESVLTSGVRNHRKLTVSQNTQFCQIASLNLWHLWLWSTTGTHQPLCACYHECVPNKVAGECIFSKFIDPGLFTAYEAPNPPVQKRSSLCKCLIQNNRNIHQGTLGCMQGGLNILNIVQTGPAGLFNSLVLLFLSAAFYIMFTPRVCYKSWHRKSQPVSAA